MVVSLRFFLCGPGKAASFGGRPPSPTDLACIPQARVRSGRMGRPFPPTGSDTT
jgi:hypothetical protein